MPNRSGAAAGSRHSPGRRRCLQAALAAAVTAPAIGRAEIVVKHLGIFSLLGDSVRVYGREMQEVNFKDVGMDALAGAAAQAAALQVHPQAQIRLYRAPEQVSVDDQRAIGRAAFERGTLPDWIARAAREASLSHLVLITSEQGPMEFRTGLSQVVGNDFLTGVGFFMGGRDSRVTNTETGASSWGYIAPFIQLRMSLLDAAGGSTLNNTKLSQGYIVGSRTPEGPDPWQFLTRAEKAEALRGLLQSNVSRGMAALLKTP